ncbi:DUF6300 family protein [Kitasatospora sp. NPDC052868]|uniref:DUF6300 family protein n=1 Tax=Kitasatospora sp. NPDC052868 TaxID=3364060 RepID=UPI0037C8B760
MPQKLFTFLTSAEAECGRCQGAVLLAVSVPVGDGVELRLCAGCDAGAGAGGELVAYYLAEDFSDGRLGPLTVAWMCEAMAAQGWRQIPHSAPSLN